MSKRRDYHVIPSPGGGWSVRREGIERAGKVFDTKADAMQHARRLASDSKSDLIEHGRDGRIRDHTSYGRDPLPPKDSVQRNFEIRPEGYGSLGKQFKTRRGVDITKPIFEQTSKEARSRRSK